MMRTTSRITLAEYDRKVASGAYDEDERLELIHGEERAMSPIGPTHEVVVDRLNEWSIRNAPEAAMWVRVQNSIGIPALDSAPQPDLVWAVRKDYTTGRPQPKDVLLIVEVAESSLTYDRTTKADLYAEAEIKGYWIVNLPERCLEVYRDPQQGRYRSMQTYHPGQEVRPLAAGELALPVAIVFGE